MKNLLPILLLLLAYTTALAQKREVERGINLRDAPAPAKQWLNDAYDDPSKVRWYYQTDGEKKVYEAKLKRKRQWHSIEFLPEGEILDIEITVKFAALDKEAQKHICEYLSTTYSKFKIDKIQTQYSGKSQDLQQFIKEDEGEKQLTKKYEIEYYGRETGAYKLWEAHFDNTGRFIEKRRIQLKSTDVLDY